MTGFEREPAMSDTVRCVVGNACFYFLLTTIKDHYNVQLRCKTTV